MKLWQTERNQKALVMTKSLKPVKNQPMPLMRLLVAIMDVDAIIADIMDAIIADIMDIIMDDITRDIIKAIPITGELI